MNRIPFLLVLALTACGETKEDSNPDDTGDTVDCPDVEYTMAFSEVTATADTPNNQWIYEALLDGWASSVQMDIYQSAGGVWTEFFSLQQIDFDPCGAWDQWGRTLTDSNDINDYVEDGDFTLNDPTDTQWANMTWMFTAFDYTDQNVYDCVVGGAEPEVYADYACRSIDLAM